MGALSDNIVPFFEQHFSLLFLIIFVIEYLIVHSDVFIEMVLRKFDGAVEGNYSTTWGTMIQGAVLLLAYYATLVCLSMVM